MVKKFLLLLALFLMMSSVEAAILTNDTPSVQNYTLLDKTLIGSNSESYYTNYVTLVDNLFAPQFNVTQRFKLANGKTILWTPWMDSSSSCTVSNFQDTDINPANYTHNSMVSDEFSEVGILVSQSNNESRFLEWNETFYQLNGSAGILPMWRVERLNNTINLTTNDSASDASLRFAMAYYYAAMNPLFTEATRNSSRLTADQIMSDHIKYETVKGCYSTNYGNGQVCYWLAGGKENGITNRFNSDPFIYTGYFPDAITATLMAYNSTGNVTYLNASEDYIEQYLLATNWTNSTGFRVAPYNWKWDNTTTPLNITPGNTYYFNKSHEQWDDSDAPRTLLLCDNLRLYYNYVSPTFSGAYKNLTDYCRSYINSNTATDGTTAIQYYFNGTNATSIRSGFYENGLGAGMLTFWSYPAFGVKVNETLTHYSWSSKTYDSATCYGVYRGVRPAKNLALGMGLSSFENMIILPLSSDGGNVSSSTCTTGEAIGYPLLMIILSLCVLLVSIYLLKGDLDTKDLSFNNINLRTIILTAITLIILISFVSAIGDTIAARCTL